MRGANWRDLFKPKVLTEMPGYLQAYRSWYCRNSFSLYFKSAIKPNIKLMNIEELFLHPWLWSVFPLIFFIFSIFESCPVFIPVLSYSHWHCILFPVVLQKFFKTFRHARLTDQTAGLNPEKSWSLFVQIYLSWLWAEPCKRVIWECRDWLWTAVFHKHLQNIGTYYSPSYRQILRTKMHGNSC